jgi:flagellar biosynthesis/type III secretory pathway protein FliH
MSAVIKTDRSRGPALGAQRSTLNLEDFAAEANGYLDQVRAQAAEIIASANKEAELVRARAHEAGQQRAWETAQSLANHQLGQQLDTLMPALGQAIEKIHELRAEFLGHWQRRMVAMSVAIARRILRRELTEPARLAEKLIHETLEMAAGSAPIQLHLNPQDHETLKDHLPRMFQQLGSLAPSHVVPDPSVSPGGCVVKTDFGQIDQTVEAQLDRLEQELAP